MARREEGDIQVDLHWLVHFEPPDNSWFGRIIGGKTVITATTALIGKKPIHHNTRSAQLSKTHGHHLLLHNYHHLLPSPPLRQNPRPRLTSLPARRGPPHQHDEWEDSRWVFHQDLLPNCKIFTYFASLTPLHYSQKQ